VELSLSWASTASGLADNMTTLQVGHRLPTSLKLGRVSSRVDRVRLYGERGGLIVRPAKEDTDTDGQYGLFEPDKDGKRCRSSK
jgi:hypothetical protein